MSETYKLRLVKSGPPNVTVFVLGGTGSGKTTLIANLADDKHRFIIFDTKDDFPPEFFIHGTPKTAETCDGLRRLLNSGEPRIVVNLSMSNEPEREMDLCLGFVMRWQTRNPHIETWIVVDELNQFCNVNQCVDNLRAIMQRGRSVGIKKIFGAQWFGTIPTWARDGFTELWVFKHQDSAGLERLSQQGFDTDIIYNLPQFTCQRLSGGNFTTLNLAIDGAETKQTTTTQDEET